VPTKDPARRAVVTGLGAVTPIGNTAKAYWDGLLAGVSGVGPITQFDPSGLDVRIAAEVKDFDPAVAMDRKMARRMSRFIHLAMAAAAEAVADSGIDFDAYDQDQRDRVAVCLNTGGGGLEQVLEGTQVIADKGPGQVSPFAIPALSGSMAACQISMKYHITGPVITQVAACASSVIAFIDGMRMIRDGEVDVALVGGSEGSLLPIAFAALGNMGALSRRNDDPTHASRPFDRDRDGFVFGEGAAVVVLESAEHAMARGAKIICEVAGGGMTADAFHISAPDPSGRGAAAAMTKALRNADVAPDEVDYIVAHGTSTPLNDMTETKAIKAAFRRARLQGRDQLAQVDGRPPARRRRCGERPGRDRRDPRRRHAADGEPGQPGSGMRPGLHPQREAGQEGRYGDHQRLRLRRAERGRGLPHASRPKSR
jgi:3-oxoacyl-[acyl-carrier-protein] synthase II